MCGRLFLTVFENDQVLVQRVTAEAGQWAGEHSHPGNQLVVVLKGGTVTYREDGKERDETRNSGDVIWRDKVESHDHAPKESMEILIINLK